VLSFRLELTDLTLGRDMRRREFLGVLGGAAVAWPQMIGRLSFASRDAALRYTDRFLEGMLELGYTEGRDFDMACGMANFDTDRLPRAAAQFFYRALPDSAALIMSCPFKKKLSGFTPTRRPDAGPLEGRLTGAGCSWARLRLRVGASAVEVGGVRS
jgi:hypothetical protein